MSNLPAGQITFLFTDIEGSTKLWERCPDAMRIALARHDAILRESIERNCGHVFKTVGDAFCAAFPSAWQALSAALESHLALKAEPWGETGPIRVRMGLHSGEAEQRDNDYFGQTLNRVARLQAIGHGQQTLLSHAVAEAVKDILPPLTRLQDRGLQRLKDLHDPEHVWQLDHPELPDTFPPLRSLDYLPTNLPRQSNAFIGREQEQQQVRALLHKTPLVTLIGAGGCGKTRLALQVAADMLDRYPDGVWLVELEALTDKGLVPQTMAAVLALQEEHGRTPLQTLTEYLRTKKLMLILDNCEHLIDACAALVQTILRICPDVTVLATSREALNIPGETVWRIPSLQMPDPDHLLPSGRTGERYHAMVLDAIRTLMEYDACRLFVARAQAHKPAFAVDAQNVRDVASLCRQLDGIPFALELAASRLRTMDVAQIRERLSDRFRLLVGGSRTALPRQQTLWALIDWSYEPLNATEKTVLHRLSLFSGGWTLEACENICSDSTLDTWEVGDALTALVDKSLVVREARDQQSRYRLFETVRQFSRERLKQTGEEEQIARAHCAYFLELAEQAERKLLGPERDSQLKNLEVELDNLRMALNSLSDSEQDQEIRLRFVCALARFWANGRVREGWDIASTAIRDCRDSAVPCWRAAALCAAGYLGWNLHLYDDASGPLNARGLLLESLALWKTLRKSAGEASGRLEAARGMAWAFNHLGNVAHNRQEDAEAAHWCCKCLRLRAAIFRLTGELDDERLIAGSLHNLGEIAHYQGELALKRRAPEAVLLFQAAYQLFAEACRINQKTGNRAWQEYNLEYLVYLALDQEKTDAAREYLCSQYDLLGDSSPLSLVTMFEQLGYLLLGEFAAAQAAPSMAPLPAGTQTEPAPVAAVQADLNNVRFAARMFGLGDRIRRENELLMEPNFLRRHQKHKAYVRKFLGRTGSLAAHQEGGLMTIEQGAQQLGDALTQRPHASGVLLFGRQSHRHLPDLMRPVSKLF